MLQNLDSLGKYEFRGVSRDGKRSCDRFEIDLSTSCGRNELKRIMEAAKEFWLGCKDR